MNWTAIRFDWNQVRAFLATAEEGSLSAAARALGQTQPTLSRQVNGLEQELGVTLFERGPRTMRLTTAGRDLLVHVRAMGDAAQTLSLLAAGRSQAVDGQVTITCTDMIACSVLPPVLAEIRDLAPALTLEILPANEVRDLTQREADIAIRHIAPEQGTLVARRLPDAAAHLYGAESYLQRRGTPAGLEDLARHDFVGLAPMGRFLPAVQAQIGVGMEHFRTAISTGVGAVALVRAGLGLGILPRHAAEPFADLRPLLVDLVRFPFPTWIVTHRELHTSRRIRLVFDALVAALGRPGIL